MLNRRSAPEMMGDSQIPNIWFQTNFSFSCIFPLFLVGRLELPIFFTCFSMLFPAPPSAQPSPQRRPFHDVHPTLAVDLVGRSPKAWLKKTSATPPKCHDRKVVDSGSAPWWNWSRGQQCLGASWVGALGMAVGDFLTPHGHMELSFLPPKDKFVQCPKECPIYADDRADGVDCNFECVEVAAAWCWLRPTKLLYFE